MAQPNQHQLLITYSTDGTYKVQVDFVGVSFPSFFTLHGQGTVSVGIPADRYGMAVLVSIIGTGTPESIVGNQPLQLHVVAR